MGEATQTLGLTLTETIYKATQHRYEAAVQYSHGFIYKPKAHVLYICV